jgi:hypothetical protein
MYKIFPRNLARASSPVVSANRLGRITLNAAAARKMLEKQIEYVYVLWDADARKFALQRCPEPDATAYQLRFAEGNAGAGFSAKPFLKTIGYEFEETIALATQWLENEQLLEVCLPTESFNKKYRFPRTRKSKKVSGGAGNEVNEKELAASSSTARQ